MNANTHYVQAARMAPRAAPPAESGVFARVRAALFGTWASTLLTALVLLALVVAGGAFVEWALLKAVLVPDAAALARCRAAEGSGACWPVVAEKWRLVLFGLYPYAEQWRPALACVLLTAILALSATPRLWRRSLAVFWAAGAAAVSVLMWGGVAGLPAVPSDQWGGLAVTLLLATIGLLCAFPLGILLALARRSEKYPALGACAVAYIELVRSIPLLAVLFMASVMFPLLLPQDVTVSKLLRVQVAIGLFSAAYLAEVIRGALQAIPKGQFEAADALGLGYWNRTLFIVLPQALRIAIPGIVNTFISFFKATSIVVVVGIFDIMTATKRAISDPLWQGFGFELYLFAGAIYFAFCFSMSRYSLWLERRLARAR